jgi:hypothetical protein
MTARSKSGLRLTIKRAGRMGEIQCARASSRQRREAGASIWKLSEVSRHKSLDTLRGYATVSLPVVRPIVLGVVRQCPSATATNLCSNVTEARAVAELAIMHGLRRASWEHRGH